MFAADLFEFYIYFGYESLIIYVICRYLLPFSGLPFHFVDSFLCCAEDFRFDIVSFDYFLLFFPCLRRCIQKDIGKTHVKEHIPKFSSRGLMVLDLTFKSSINFELIFVHGVR